MDHPDLDSNPRRSFVDEPLRLSVGPVLPFLPDPLATMLPLDTHPVEEGDDIYRGFQSPVSPGHGMNSVQFPRPSSLSNSSSSSSSSSSGGLPFSNMVQTIERAIRRWARGGRTDGNSSSSNSSSSSSSSSGSSTTSRSPIRRRGRKRSSSIQSRTTSLMTRRQLREASRIVTREFVLFLPPEYSTTSRPLSSALGGVTHSNERDQVLRTPSLKLVLAQLGTALKRNAKTQRPPRPTSTAPRNGTINHTPVSLPSTRGKRSAIPNDVPRVAFDVGPSATRPPRDRGPAIGHKKAKGKQSEAPRQIFWQEQPHVAAGASGSQRAWWLDVASPTWDDMRSLGKLLHLHPLTLEDILQKEQREKFELFPRLGYYFVVFRAIERTTTDPTAALLDDASSIGKTTVQEVVDVVEATNIYLVVFKEGICTFHFEDISAHTETVRKRLLDLEETFRGSSDWIAHGIIDSVVDSFFPVLKGVTREVEEIEGMVAGLDDDPTVDYNPQNSAEEVDGTQVETATNSNTSTLAPDEQEMLDEKLQRMAKSGMAQHADTRFSRWKDTIRRIAGMCWPPFRRPHKHQPTPRSRRLHQLVKMVTTRRLLTTLARLLHTKYEVVAQVQKRLGGQGEVAIYLDDVQDHIITLQQSLEHCERALSHSQPAYLTYLRIQTEVTKNTMDKALVVLSVIAISDIAMNLTRGLVSMNVNVPASEDFSAFGIMFALTITVGCTIAGLARFWWVKSHRRRGRLQAAG